MKLIYFLIIYLATAVNGVPLFIVLNSQTSYLFYYSVLLLMYALISRRLHVTQRFRFLLFFIGYVYLTQLIIFQAGNPLKFIRLVMTNIILGYTLLNIMKKNLFKYYIDLMLVLALMSLFFWTLAVLNPSILGAYRNIVSMFNLDPLTNDHMIFFSTRYKQGNQFYKIIRNAGAFSEPGSFGTYLMLAYILSKYYYRNLKISAILIITMITTMSTAVYGGLYFILIGNVLRIKAKGRKFFYLVIISIAILLTFTQLDYVGSKVGSQFENQMDKDMTEGTSGRFFGFRKSINSLMHYPLTGRGLLYDTTVTDSYSEIAAGYGFGSVGARIGLIGLYFWFIWLYKSTLYFNRQNRYVAIFDYLALLSVFFGQSIPITSAPVMAFLYSGWYFKNLDVRELEYKINSENIKGNGNV